MQKNILLTLTLFAITAVNASCKKESTQGEGSGYFLNVNLNGQQLTSTSPIGIFGLTDQFGCDGSYTYTNQNIGQIDNSTYFIQVDITHKQNRAEFVNSSTGVYSVKKIELSATNQYPVGIPCNLDLELYIDFKNLPVEKTTLLSTNRVNNITSIEISSQTSNEVVYDIEGNFSCSVKNSANVTFPVTGSYKTFIAVLK